MKITIIPNYKGNYTVSKTVEITNEELLEIITKEQWTSSTFTNDIPEKIVKDKESYEDVIEKQQLILKEDSSSILSYKNNENFLTKSLIEFDYDDGLNLSDALTIFGNYSHIIGLSKSHQKEKNGKPKCDRFRVILFPNRSMTSKEEVAQCLKGLIDKLKLPLPDKVSFVPAQMWYPITKVVSYEFDYQKIDVDQMISNSPTPVKKKERISSEETKKLIKRYKLSPRTEEFLKNGIPENDDKPFHKHFYSALLNIYANGYSKEEAIELLKKVPHTIEYQQINFKNKYMTTIEEVYNGFHDEKNYFLINRKNYLENKEKK